MTYLITFGCYGARLHGSESGSVDRFHHLPGSRMLGFVPWRLAWERNAMREAPYLLDSRDRDTVLAAIREVCGYRDWVLIAAHIRQSHAHVVVAAEVCPEKAMNDFKAYASRALKRRWGGSRARYWARHGSTRWLWNDQAVRKAVDYVVEGQGEAMAVYWDPGVYGRRVGSAC